MKNFLFVISMLLLGTTANAQFKGGDFYKASHYYKQNDFLEWEYAGSGHGSWKIDMIHVRVEGNTAWVSRHRQKGWDQVNGETFESEFKIHKKENSKRIFRYYIGTVSISELTIDDSNPEEVEYAEDLTSIKEKVRYTIIRR